MEQIQVIAEKEMTSKLLKQFTTRTLIYSFLYFATIVLLFIFGSVINSVMWFALLVTAINVLFLMLLCRLATTDAFEGINTTSASNKSLKRIVNAASIPMFIFTCLFTFIDIIFFHSVFDVSAGYTKSSVISFVLIPIINIIIWSLVVNIYEKRIIKKYLTLDDENN